MLEISSFLKNLIASSYCARKLCPRISNSGFKQDIDIGPQCLLLPPPPFRSWLYRDIGTDRSTLKPHFTPSNYTPKWHSLSSFHSVVPFSPHMPSTLYIRAFPPFVFIRVDRKRGSFESLLSFLVFHGLMLLDQCLVGGIYLGNAAKCASK